MKYLIIILITILSSCAMFSNRRNANMRRYQCVRNLVEIKVPANEAISFCSKNFQINLEE